MSNRKHRGHDPEAYDDTKAEGPSLGRECPLCGKAKVLLPYHLPCDAIQQPNGEQ